MNLIEYITVVNALWKFGPADAILAGAFDKAPDLEIEPMRQYLLPGSIFFKLYAVFGVHRNWYHRIV